MRRVVSDPEYEKKKRGCMPSPGYVMYEVVSIHDVDVSFPDTEGMQVWTTVGEEEPAVDIDTDIVVNELWAVLTVSVVRVGIPTHVAMIEQSFYLLKSSRKVRNQVAFQIYRPGRRWRAVSEAN